MINLDLLRMIGDELNQHKEEARKLCRETGYDFQFSAMAIDNGMYLAVYFLFNNDYSDKLQSVWEISEDEFLDILNESKQQN